MGCSINRLLRSMKIAAGLQQTAYEMPQGKLLTAESLSNFDYACLWQLLFHCYIVIRVLRYNKVQSSNHLRNGPSVPPFFRDSALSRTSAVLPDFPFSLNIYKYIYIRYRGTKIRRTSYKKARDQCQK
jgi:hypothetical protein